MASSGEESEGEEEGTMHFPMSSILREMVDEETNVRHHVRRFSMLRRDLYKAAVRGSPSALDALSEESGIERSKAHRAVREYDDLVRSRAIGGEDQAREERQIASRLLSMPLKSVKKISERKTIHPQEHLEEVIAYDIQTGIRRDLERNRKNLKDPRHRAAFEEAGPKFAKGKKPGERKAGKEIMRALKKYDPDKPGPSNA